MKKKEKLTSKMKILKSRGVYEVNSATFKGRQEMKARLNVKRDQNKKQEGKKDRNYTRQIFRET